MNCDRIPVWLDTDPGSDIDDALALAYLLAQPRCELIGVSTVSGDTLKRAAIVHHLCHLAGRGDVPILAGLCEPLGSGPGQPEVPHFEALPSSAKAIEPDAEDAIDGLYRRLSERPGEVTLLAIGPMTNVGALFLRYPDAPRLLKQIMLMCGAFRSRPDREVPEVEHNVRCDPDAAKVLFERAAEGSIRAVGLDVTLDCRLSETECRARFAAGGPVLRAILEMAEVWFKGAPQIIFHDPLAATMLFAPEVGAFGLGDVCVDVGEAQWPGKTHWTRNPKGRHFVAESVDSDAFFTHYFGTVGG